LLGILNFFRGSVRVEVRGAYPERFLNICAVNRIGFWKMARVAPDILHITVTVSDFKRLRGYAKKTGCGLHILNKRGIRFFTNRFRKRAALIAGLMVFSVAAWILTSFIWVIDINGFVNLDIAGLREHLRENGVYIGAYSPGIKLDELKNDILIKMPELSFITVNIRGGHAGVEVRKREIPPEIQSKDPCDIVARRAGIIASIVVKSGTPAVKPGDTVHAGQLLAGGYMTGRSGTTITTRADADVTARTWYTISSKMPLDTLVKTYTGEKTSRHTLIIGGRRIKLFLNSGISYKEYDKIVKNNRLTLSESIILPVSLETETFFEYTLSGYGIPEETALEYIKSSLPRYLPAAENRKIADEKYYAFVENGAACVTLTAECLEDIGIKQLITERQ
jgi:similar to stage IV sporulation protein